MSTVAPVFGLKFKYRKVIVRDTLVLEANVL